MKKRSSSANLRKLSHQRLRGALDGRVAQRASKRLRRRTFRENTVWRAAAIHGLHGKASTHARKRSQQRAAIEETNTTRTFPASFAASRTLRVPCVDVASKRFSCARVLIWSQPADRARCITASQPATNAWATLSNNMRKQAPSRALTVSASKTSPATRSNCRCSIREAFVVLRRRQRAVWPASRREATTTLPMKPAPPVTATRMSTLGHLRSTKKNEKNYSSKKE